MGFTNNCNEEFIHSIANDKELLVLPVAKKSSKTMETLESIRRELKNNSKDLDKLKLIDTLQRLGLAYHFEEEINALLEALDYDDEQSSGDLQTIALLFQLLRQNGYRASPSVFKKFMNNEGNFKESLKNDLLGLLSLHEASYLGANDEEILTKAMKFTEINLRKSIPLLSSQLQRQVCQALELPKHRRMSRLEARSYIEEYAQENNHNLDILEVAKSDYNMVQSLHQMELAEVKRWWKELGLANKLSFARDRPLECFLWTVGILPEPKHSSSRIELSKTIAILLVIDDVFDTFGKMDDLLLFTAAIQRWDLNAMEELPEYMKICYMALYNTTNEICFRILKDHGWFALPFLKSTWIDMIEGFMVEAKWFNSEKEPNLEEYIETSVSTAGAYMALVHLFFLIGQGVTRDNVKLMTKPYPKLFSCSGRILRLWDDLGTSKEEQERGDLSSSIHLYKKENNIKSDEEARKHILQLINGLWKDLNGELIMTSSSNVHGMPLSIIKAAFNMARASQVVYQHDEDSYISSVDNYVQALFFTPLV